MQVYRSWLLVQQAGRFSIFSLCEVRMSERKAEYVVSRAVVPDLPGVELSLLPDAPESAGDGQPVEDGQPGGGSPALEKAKALLRSRKFWAALVGLGLVIVKGYRPDFPISEDQLTNLVYVLVAYILGVALEDGLQAGAVKNAA